MNAHLVADRVETVVEVLDYHEHGTQRCAYVVIDGSSYGDCLGNAEFCIALDELSVIGGAA
ncbi:hypothetical protein AAI421_14640 [Rhodococcus aetherivorans]|uniref:hypothetical protein n=1 Tax=Rhodococcus aetherivorans TaxID=191292 RepID=UPI0031DE2177